MSFQSRNGVTNQAAYTKPWATQGDTVFYPISGCGQGSNSGEKNKMSVISTVQNRSYCRTQENSANDSLTKGMIDIAVKQFVTTAC